MNTIKIVSLYSGSGGNATLVETQSASILIDAGKSARSLNSALKQAGSDISRISAIFVTHEHTDHISALEVLEKKNSIPIHMTKVSADSLHSAKTSRIREHIVPHAPVFSEKIADMTVTSFTLSHDSAMCVGYRIDTDGGESFGIATDTGYVTEEMLNGLCGCRSVMIECNHSTEMLRKGPYPAELKARIMSRQGHLSNDDCASLAQKLAAGGTSSFVLAHISLENNCPEHALNTVRRALEQYPDAQIRCAKPEEETVI